MAVTKQSKTHIRIKEWKCLDKPPGWAVMCNSAETFAACSNTVTEEVTEGVRNKAKPAASVHKAANKGQLKYAEKEKEKEVVEVENELLKQKVKDMEKERESFYNFDHKGAQKVNIYFGGPYGQPPV